MILNKLKVLELKRELERRNLSTVGDKNSLMLRLKEAMVTEGLDPEKHEFDGAQADTEAENNDLKIESIPTVDKTQNVVVQTVDETNKDVEISQVNPKPTVPSGNFDFSQLMAAMNQMSCDMKQQMREMELRLNDESKQQSREMNQQMGDIKTQMGDKMDNQSSEIKQQIIDGQHRMEEKFLELSSAFGQGGRRSKSFVERTKETTYISVSGLIEDSDGMTVEEEVVGQSRVITMDTGAAHSFVDGDLEDGVELADELKLAEVDGQYPHIGGEEMVTVSSGDTQVQHEVYVADKRNGAMGMDFGANGFVVDCELGVLDESNGELPLPLCGPEESAGHVERQQQREGTNGAEDVLEEGSCARMEVDVGTEPSQVEGTNDEISGDSIREMELSCKGDVAECGKEEYQPTQNETRNGSRVDVRGKLFGAEYPGKFQKVMENIRRRIVNVRKMQGSGKRNVVGFHRWRRKADPKDVGSIRRGPSPVIGMRGSRRCRIGRGKRGKPGKMNAENEKQYSEGVWSCSGRTGLGGG